VLRGLAHVDLVCRDVARSLAFYRAVLGPLGLGAVEASFEGERGEAITYLRFPGEGTGSLGLRPTSGAEVDEPFRLYAPGLHHVAFAVDTTEDVDAAYEAALAADAEILHPPRLWPEYHPRYYATFFLDPDGFRVEVRSR
jgi:glyoxylase I family protein